MHPSYPDLAGKVILVTGGSRGIGAATCRLFARNGARVAVNGRDPSAIDTVVADIRASGGESIGVAADCTDFQAIEGMRAEVERGLGPVDILAARAGAHGGLVAAAVVWRRVTAPPPSLPGTATAIPPTARVRAVD